MAQTRSQLEGCYCSDNGRVAVEPVLLLGVSLLQYLEAMPDRQAVELLRYHAGWNFALNRQVGDEVFHPTTLVNFRQRLLDHDLSTIGFQAVLEALIEAGLVARQSRQRLDSTQMFGRVSRMSRLDCVRESLRLTLQELAEQLPPAQRPRLVVASCGNSTSRRKPITAPRSKRWRARWWRRARPPSRCWAGWPVRRTRSGPRAKQAQLLARVFAEQFEVLAAHGDAATQGQGAVEFSERVQNPHDPDATYASKGKGEQRKEHVGYKVQVAETVSEAVLAPGEPTRNFIAGMVTHAARESDEEGALKMEAEQQAWGWTKPPVQYVDAAYISAEKLR